MSNPGAITLASDENKLNNATHSAETNAWHLIAEGDWLAGQRFDIHGHAVLGRDSSCDITIPGTHLSRRHAELAIRGSVLQIRDLCSSNGTYVNKKRVTEAELHPGDQVQFDVLAFRVHGPTKAIDKNATRVRLVPQPPKKQTTPAPATIEKQWKTKTTSQSNRDESIHITTGQKAAHSLGRLMAVTSGVVIVAAIVYMITEL